MLIGEVNNQNLRKTIQVSGESMKLLVNHYRYFLGQHEHLQELDMSWNHIRRHGAIDISRAIKVNIFFLKKVRKSLII